MKCSPIKQSVLGAACAAAVAACSGSVSAPEPYVTADENAENTENTVVREPRDAGVAPETGDAEPPSDASGPTDSGTADAGAEPNATSQFVEFTIPLGTGRGPWNTRDDTLVVYVGQTLRIYNADDRNHILHTFGTPCEHGDTISRGEFRDHPITSRHEPDPERAQLYDHDSGETARFWLRAIPRPTEGEP